ncbi:GM14965 [Drosophila sechellia]|uniref:GM14965 n=1 Tax=Drosophila sechellia TaxID=7238 RepID=B4IFQ2_DROSE|nr:GM14965 [Drosophila sechellia]
MERENYSAEYFERALARAYGCEMLRVENFHIEAVSQKGENFCSAIYRVALDFRRSPGGALESGKYILKDLLPAVAALGTNEKDMFELLLPAMQAILEEAPKEIGERKLSPNCLLVEISAGKELYIMEDLGALGYGSFDRRQGLNLEEAKICVRKLAQFHGASKVDFQNCYWGSPAIDLYFLFYTSLKPELLLNSQDEILNHYFDNLLETLRQCGYKDTLPTFGQLKDEMKRCLFYGYYTVVCELPICCSSPEASVDFGVHTFVDTDAMLKKRHQLFANERVRQTIKSTLLMLDSEGILETP